MGQIKNIKLHIVTDIKVCEQTTCVWCNVHHNTPTSCEAHPLHKNYGNVAGNSEDEVWRTCWQHHLHKDIEQGNPLEVHPRGRAMCCIPRHRSTGTCPLPRHPSSAHAETSRCTGRRCRVVGSLVVCSEEMCS